MTFDGSQPWAGDDQPHGRGPPEFTLAGGGRRSPQAPLHVSAHSTLRDGGPSSHGCQAAGVASAPRPHAEHRVTLLTGEGQRHPERDAVLTIPVT